MSDKNLTTNGFTLLEIMVTILIFSIIVTTIFGSYNSVLSTSGSLRENSRLYAMGENCMSRMINDLEACYIELEPIYRKPGFDDPPDPYRLMGDTVYVGNKNFSRLRFTSFAHLSFQEIDQNGIAEIVYYVTETKDGKFVLKRSDNLYPGYRFMTGSFEPSAMDPVLCEEVVQMDLQYIAQDDTAYDSWDSDTDTHKYSTPKAVKIKLGIGGENAPILFETLVGLTIYREEIGQ